MMHARRQQILDLLSTKNGRATLSDVRSIPGLHASALLNHHLDALEATGYIKVDRALRTVKLLREPGTPKVFNPQFIRIPVYGSANCGPGTFFAEEHVTEHLSVTPSALNDLARKNVHDLVAVKAKGTSMNNADIDNKTIEENDYVIVNRSDRNLMNDRCFLVTFNDMAMIKKFYLSQDRTHGLLVSDSKEFRDPIIVTPNDDFAVSGRVVQVFKTALA